MISDEAFNEILNGLSQGQQWLAYNSTNYFLEKGDVFMFRHEEQADEFAMNNISDYDLFDVVQVNSIRDLMEKLVYGEALKMSYFLTQNKKVMNEKNYDYLSNQLKYSGFGDELNEKLKEKINLGQPEFQLFQSKNFGKDETVATLLFKKPENSDMYFFNRYSLMLKSPKMEAPVKQTFYINNKEDNITLKEGYNLLSGRAVHKELTSKEGEKQNAWVQMNFKETDAAGNFKLKSFYDNYGFDLQKELAKHPIKELKNEEDQKQLLASLQRGNRQSVTIATGGNESKVFIEAAPQFKSLNFYDEKMYRLRPEQLKGLASKEENLEPKQDQKKTQKLSAGTAEEEPEEAKSQKKSRRKGQKVT